MKRARVDDTLAVAEAEGPITNLLPELVKDIMRLAPNRALFYVSRAWNQWTIAAELPWWDTLLNDRERYDLGCRLVIQPFAEFVNGEPSGVQLHHQMQQWLDSGQLSHAFLDEAALLFDTVKATTSEGDESPEARRVMSYLFHLQPLGMRNWHRRDLRVTFVDTVEEQHRYKILHWGGRAYELLSNDPLSAKAFISVTTYHDTIFTPFDRAGAITAVLNSWRYKNDATYRYHGMTGEQVGAAWDKASLDGSDNHQNLENYFNGHPHDAERIEFRHFLSFQAAHIDGKWRAYRSEQILYSEPLRLVGSVDMLYEPLDPALRFDAQGRRRLFLVDWKFCNRIEKKGFRGAVGRVKATDDVPDCNVAHYTVQLHWYMVLLERYYGVVIVSLALLFLHRDQTDFIMVDVPRNDRMIRRIMAHRLGELARRRANERLLAPQCTDW
jgi:hypothetical protein